MRHRIKHRKLSRDSEHRWCLLRNLVTSLVLHDRITTTLPKAKEAQRLANRLITWAKRGTDGSRRKIEKFLYLQKFTMPKLFGAMLQRYSLRQGGYTRIIKCGHDKLDSSPLAILEYIDAPGDTMLALSKLQLPKVTEILERKSQEIEKIKLLQEYDLHPRTQEFQLRRLTQSVHQLSKLKRKLTDIIALKYLPDNFEEVKFPAKDETIWKDKQVWREPLNDLDKKGNPRFVIRKKEELKLIKSPPNMPSRKLVNRHLAV